MKVLSLKRVVCYNKISQCALISQLLDVVCSNTVLISADVLTDFCVSYIMLGQFTIGCEHFNNINNILWKSLDFAAYVLLELRLTLQEMGSEAKRFYLCL